MNDPLLTELQETLHCEMPISAAMGIRVEPSDVSRLAMSMPLEENRNHQFTAFAGSLNALCTVVGWGTVYLMLRRRGLDGNIVIHRSTIKYRLPVHDRLIVARAVALPAEEIDYFFDLLDEKGQSKLDVTVEIPGETETLVIFRGSYVVLDASTS